MHESHQYQRCAPPAIAKPGLGLPPPFTRMNGNSPPACPTHSRRNNEEGSKSFRAVDILQPRRTLRVEC
jgi:hypothetical protein